MFCSNFLKADTAQKSIKVRSQGKSNMRLVRVRHNFFKPGLLGIFPET
jgi:hypothetical protein